MHGAPMSAFEEPPQDSDYLLNLAVTEGSFLAEYRVDPRGFDILHELLDSTINRTGRFSAVSMATSGSSEITPASRLGAALIMPTVPFG